MAPVEPQEEVVEESVEEPSEITTYETDEEIIEPEKSLSPG